MALTPVLGLCLFHVPTTQADPWPLHTLNLWHASYKLSISFWLMTHFFTLIALEFPS